ncbi:glycosyltransferase [Candidatus Dojkabacteria bacterium]|jgi:GT2 family glycosyltransferase|nr:glycosyltransferase [Candidatus Dojkabacteria bacterium]
MQTLPLVSIVISTYKSKTLPIILEALEKQTDKRFEVIVSDDGSNDYKLVGERSYPIKYVWHKKRGREWSYTHNLGIKLSEGKYVMFLHDDILPSKDLVETYLKHADENTVLLGIRSDIKKNRKSIKDPESNVLNEDFRLRGNPTLKDLAKDNAVDMNENFSEHWYLASGCMMFFPKDKLVKIGGCPMDYPGQGLEDYDIVLRLTRLGLKTKMLLNAIGYHFDHPALQGKDVDINIAEFDKRKKDFGYLINHYV